MINIFQYLPYSAVPISDELSGLASAEGCFNADLKLIDGLPFTAERFVTSLSDWDHLAAISQIRVDGSLAYDFKDVSRGLTFVTYVYLLLKCTDPRYHARPQWELTPAPKDTGTILFSDHLAEWLREYSKVGSRAE